ncbi:MAG: hypothetical protein WAW59_07060 [Patescibacteria group bacterium]
MFIDNIKLFHPAHSNMSREVFFDVLSDANKNRFNIYKMEKDFLLTLILIQFSDTFPDLVFK